MKSGQKMMLLDANRDFLIGATLNLINKYFKMYAHFFQAQYVINGEKHYHI